jgi:L-aspartate oxidase
MTTRTTDYDVIVVGSGVAGLATALGLAGVRRVALVTSGDLGSGSTAWAQGGLAAAIASDDSPELHAADTLTAGATFGDAAAVTALADSATTAIADLLRYGADFDRDAGGELALTREGGHSRRRVVHAGGDATGAEVSRTLIAALRNSDVEVVEHTSVRDLLTIRHDGAGVVTGAILAAEDGQLSALSTRALVLASGGAGHIFDRSTNPPEVDGSGLGLAMRAGASLADLEFVQFHPTALDIDAGAGQVPLITEALRGEGAVLRDERGAAVMAGCHPLADLAPRDIVARRIDEIIAAGGAVRLDVSAVRDIVDRFPTVVAACRRHGIDPATTPIPVAPAQHFLCGGVRTDAWGATDVAGLYAVGEVAATGVHGANRLASNSMVEGMVFGRRVAARLAVDLPAAASRVGTVEHAAPLGHSDALPEVRSWLSSAAAIRRSGYELERAAKEVAALAAGDQGLAATAILVAAAERRESRGCHWRDDHPASSEWWRQRRVVVRLGADGVPAAHLERISPDLADLRRTA